MQNPNYSINTKNRADGIALLRSISSSAAKAAFFDPQYRGVLDKLSYGNEGQGRGQARCNLPQMPEDVIATMIKDLDRVLLPSGYLFLWVDKFHLCEGTQKWLEDTNLRVVDMIVWEKLSKQGAPLFGMGYRTRRVSEYLLVTQKLPIRAKNSWSDHGIPDVWQEHVTKVHPHSKPIKLQKRLIDAVTEPGGRVVDPAAGGFSVLEACKQSGRNFLGCDLIYGAQK